MNQICPDLEKLATPIADLRSDPKNVRRHDERSIAAAMGSLNEFGQQKPIVAIGDGTVIAGNGVLEAARRLGWDRIAVVRFEDEEKARAYAIADNRTAELSSWDQNALADALQEIVDDGMDIETLGFTEFEFDRMLSAGEQQVDPNAEWNAGGMPEFEQPDKTAYRQIVMNFKSDDDAAAFGELIGQNVTDKTRSLWYPQAEIERLMDKRVVGRSDDGKK